MNIRNLRLLGHIWPVCAFLRLRLKWFTDVFFVGDDWKAWEQYQVTLSEILNLFGICDFKQAGLHVDNFWSFFLYKNDYNLVGRKNWSIPFCCRDQTCDFFSCTGWGWSVSWPSFHIWMNRTIRCVSLCSSHSEQSNRQKRGLVPAPTAVCWVSECHSAISECCLP